MHYHGAVACNIWQGATMKHFWGELLPNNREKIIQEIACSLKSINFSCFLCAVLTTSLLFVGLECNCDYTHFLL